MNYKNIHDAIISKAQGRALEGYTEKHHIVPKCLGGDESHNNIVVLTAREHYVIHQLLVKIYPENTSLVYAAHMMTVNSNGRGRVNNRLYEWLKTKNSLARTGTKHSIEAKRKMSKAQSGKNNPFFGKTLSEDHKRKISIAKTGKFGFKHSPETKKKMRLARLGKTFPRIQETVN